MTAERRLFLRRRWRARIGRVRPLLAVCLGIGMLALAGYAVFVATWLDVDDVVVSGNQQVAEKAVLEAAGIEAGTPLARVDLDGVQRRIEALPAVAEATAHRSWPHTVEITVIERKAVAAVRQGARWRLFDDAGVAFRTVPERDPDLPVVAFDGAADPTALREVADVIDALPDDLSEQTRRIVAQSRDSITLELSGGRQVVWGSAAESDRKGEVLAVLLSRKANVYDVSVPEQPTTTG